ncbi:T9SS type B sorting domain-containing protein [Winogradskyella echinorum]|uniref:T9SS type B sorting domain-containing protein n=1 Tax=Winogradskyella echinorum TaxID=538189 RepID=A0ABR6Y3F2_9FLAO|nr:choice-of-anchor L domain-containing protein [Winogradskyella echinorum]MBC3847262.1 T9SS type B sorting domain-containing protein [Winogradskyella echinorum]MBC5751610.1 T9SS type B sorting domain-containing protein [Winogradskyella echinorum]
MKRTFLIVTLLFSLLNYAQNISVDSQTYTPQQLIEDILIDSDCIENVVVTNVSGGDFNGTDFSYGFFDAAGTSFPFQSGLVLSTGRLQNVPGPNNTLSDDNAPNWEGDADLEFALNESNTINATILEFDFTSVASQISFRYLFASEEYQENNPNSCNFSDLFGFLIRPASSQDPYENIALVPDTNTPVKATTVTPGVQGSCPPQNEAYFGNYNGTNAPINFNGQTAVLTATANVVPNQTYHVKLVIADEQNFRYDSAVFLEAASFQLSTDLGPNRLIATTNALCEGDTLELIAYQDGQNTYDWYRNGVLVQGAPLGCGTCGSYTVSEPGTYTVEVGLANGCISYGEIVIETSPPPVGNDAILVECDQNQDGLTTFNLFDASSDLTNNDNSATVSDFFLNEIDALANENTIANASSFQNEIPFQTVFARIANSDNCFDIAELELQTSNNTLNIPNLEVCDGIIVDGFASFDLNDIAISIQGQIPTGATLSYYLSEEDAYNDINTLLNNFENTTADFQTLYVRVENNNQCYSISSVNLVVLYTPVLEADETIFYCTNTYPETITLYGGVRNDLPNNYYYEWLFNGTSTEVDTSFNEVNETGTYTVIVTDPNGCSVSRTIIVSPSSSATIETVSVEGLYPNNTVTISVSGDGIYEYALDDSNGFYQESNIFSGVTGGFYTVFVRDINGCSIIEETISVLGFPKFFTPNGDTKNDVWQVVGSNTQFSLIETIEIFNRYGKLISTQTISNSGWDGSLNGEDLPSDDYWFVTKFLDGKTYTGHFALRR